VDTEEMIKKLSYKPGWAFHYKQDQYYDVLIISGLVPDSRDPSRMLAFEARRPIPGYLQTAGQDEFCDWVGQLLLEAEYHELREYFRYDGELTDNPHKVVTGL
jgi:hypothetical protein